MKSRINSYRHLMRREAQVGGNVFGSVPSGRRREFVCLDEGTWLWHEEWLDADGRTHAVTTRYDVGKKGITKSQNGRTQVLTAEEALNLLQAAYNYHGQICRELYAA